MMQKYLLAVIAILLVMGGGYYYFALKQPAGGRSCSLEAKLCPDGSTVGRGGPKCEFAACPSTDQTPQADSPTRYDDGGLDAGPIQFSGTVLAGSKAKLIEFNKADYDKAVVSGNLVVLYFYANWCPICKAEFPKMQAAFNELSSDRVVAFRVNFKDNETSAEEEALARQFGVPYQHTKVFLKGGKQVLKAPDSWDTERYISEITSRI